jgi:hypothetical protein
MRNGSRLVVFALGLAWSATGLAQSGDDADGDAADIVATQVRDQGYQCDEPTSATQDQESEGDAVWTLKCANATYRVRLVPDMAAAIEKVD